MSGDHAPCERGAGLGKRESGRAREAPAEGLGSRLAALLKGERVSPHVIRHTTAVRLLRAGVDINTIRAWLGHIDTTNIYAEVDLEMKAKALNERSIPGAPRRSWHKQSGLMACSSRSDGTSVLSAEQSVGHQVVSRPHWRATSKPTAFKRLRHMTVAAT